MRPNSPYWTYYSDVLWYSCLFNYNTNVITCQWYWWWLSMDYTRLFQMANLKKLLTLTTNGLLLLTLAWLTLTGISAYLSQSSLPSLPMVNCWSSDNFYEDPPPPLTSWERSSPNLDNLWASPTSVRSQDTGRELSFLTPSTDSDVRVFYQANGPVIRQIFHAFRMFVWTAHQTASVCPSVQVIKFMSFVNTYSLCKFPIMSVGLHALYYYP